MPAVYFIKLSEHTATIRDEQVMLWRCRTIATEGVQGGKEFYLQAKHAHLTLDKELWTDSRKMIKLDSVVLPEERKPNKKPMQQEPTLYQQVECGHCGRVNLINIDNPRNGAHQCVSCRGTICVINGIHLTLKNGSKGLNTQRGK